ncbi:hypothetical protein H4Q26_006541 [Puccinia striiformis f. sp. tritici PST-130]|nr:hypothetical protein H4Q26_006541 [Puccinia striiformis f. sp. tritici PST-130]
MANSHQDPGITRGGPPGPALNPTITQKEIALRELMDREGGSDSDGLTKIFWHCLHQELQDEMPTEVPFTSEKQLPNQSASLDILGMEEIGENGGQNISEEYGLTLESDWSFQPDLFEEYKGLNPSSTSSHSTKAPAIPAKSPRNESNNQPPSFEIPTKAPVMLENQHSNGSVPWIHLE